VTRIRYGWFVFRAFIELVRYDVWHGAFNRAHRPARPLADAVLSQSPNHELERAVCDAVVLACCLYWKPVLCLQRSVCAMRLLRSKGVAARVVIGYRPVPFFSHAWVDVGGRVVNDSPTYQKRLTVLHTI
jgi:hypothetical protein